MKKYKVSLDLVYNTWFVNNEERLKAFCSTRRSVIEVVKDFGNEISPNDCKDSFLEFVMFYVNLGAIIK